MILTNDSYAQFGCNWKQVLCETRLKSEYRKGRRSAQGRLKTDGHYIWTKRYGSVLQHVGKKTKGFIIQLGSGDPKAQTHPIFVHFILFKQMLRSQT